MVGFRVRTAIIFGVCVLASGTSRNGPQEDSLQRTLDLKLAALAAAQADGAALYKDAQSIDDELKAAESAITSTLAELDAKVLGIC
jgi:hypothetical protein